VFRIVCEARIGVIDIKNGVIGTTSKERASA
jgi:hypothetical protein